MRTIDLILYAAAAILFGLAVINVTARFNLLALGLLCWVLVPFIDLARAG